ncbi:helix-turn-helix transcriptional regulator [Paenibacillus endoradicis]|uniref:helix-turn-helix transcriptional regulator n=1 Tax=Paenibacillus endoradicis TaxID=2972487 RepID=UPI0021597ACD|nr:AraC family transcriptional regulator [Paenibacillus endoradicis]MCR8657906.1 AraC family transcriptional regulator [Paenibacillus endoradicis]
MSSSTQLIPFKINFHNDIPNQLVYHTHLSYEIYYFHAGKVNYLINDRIYKLESGDMILMHGMTLHKAHLEQNDCYERTIIHFDPFYFTQSIQPSYAPDLLIPFNKLKNIRLSFNEPVRNEIEAILHKLVLLQKSSEPFAEQRSHIVLLELMLLIYTQCQQPLQEIKQTHHISTKENHVQNIISYIEDHYYQDVSLEHIQQALHLNKFYLSKSFKEVTGTTIFQYMLERRIYAAKVLLINSCNKITDISYEVGFKHPAHFSRSFKLVTSVTAEQYRKQYSIHEKNH